MPNSLLKSQGGYIGMVVVIFLIVLSAIIYPQIFPAHTGESVTCQTGEDPPAGDTTISLPAIKDKLGATSKGGPDVGNSVDYHLVRAKVWTQIAPMFRNPNPATPQEHTILYPDANQAGFAVYYPGEWGEITKAGKTEDIYFRPSGIIFFVHLDSSGNPLVENDAYQIDYYQDDEDFIKVRDGQAGYTYADMFRCSGGGAAGVTVPNQDVSPKHDQLQLEWFLFNNGGSKILDAHCKPAVYLYPEQKQLVNVKVFPKGELGYTDPVYDPDKGWNVSAYPDGTLLTMNDEQITHDYLYYESKLYDSEIQKPDKGWVVRYEDLETFYRNTLPKLGLNSKEQKDFSDYWLRVLPKSPYYFVGIIDKSQRDYLEALQVTPKPDTSIRFSLYFKALDNFESVEAPVIQTPVRKGFTLVDWGGMVKLHPGTPFTCSQ